MKERRKTKQNSWKKKTALTSTWKNLPLEATKNSKKLKKKTIQEKKKEKKAQSNQHQSIFEHNNKSWLKTLQKLEDRKATSTWFWRTQLN